VLALPCAHRGVAEETFVASRKLLFRTITLVMAPLSKRMVASSDNNLKRITRVNKVSRSTLSRRRDPRTRAKARRKPRSLPLRPKTCDVFISLRSLRPMIALKLEISKGKNTQYMHSELSFRRRRAPPGGKKVRENVGVPRQNYADSRVR